MVSETEDDADLQARRDALERLLDEAAIRAKPQFAALEDFREIIKARVENGVPTYQLLQQLRDEKVRVTVSYDTLCRFIRERGFERPHPRRKRRKKPAQPGV
jgi:transposase